MDNAARVAGSGWTGDAFLRTDQREFGDAWRYELIDGEIFAHAAQILDHAAIIMGLGTALGNRLRDDKDGRRPEAGSIVAPRNQQLPTARILDAMVRCRDLPRVVFDVVSPPEVRAWRAGNQRRRHLQNIEGLQEIVEIYQDEAAIHIYRRTTGGQWSFDAVDWPDSGARTSQAAMERSRRWRADPPDLAAGAYHPAGRQRRLQRQNHELVRGEPRRLRVRSGT
jgi:Uma2 family endonuclease